MNVYLPDLPDGSKQGVDDFLGAGGTVKQLKYWYATSELRQPVDDTKAPRHPALLSVQDVLSRPAPQWVVDGWIEAGTLCMLYGPSSSYKSFIGLDFALSVALGKPWQGHATRCGSVLYIAAEGIGGMGKRLRAAAQHHKLDLSKARLRFVERAVSFYDRNAVDGLIGTVAAEGDPLSLIVTDTFSRNSVGANENDNSDMVKVLNHMQEVATATGAAVLMVHHVTKATGGMRGASAILNSVDTSLKAERDDLGHVQLTTDKQKDHDDSGVITLERRVITLPDGETSLVLDLVGNEQFVPPTSGQRNGGRASVYDRTLNVLKALCTATPRGVPHGAWLRACTANDDTSKSTFNRHVTTLTGQGRVTRTEGGLYRPVVSKMEGMMS